MATFYVEQYGALTPGMPIAGASGHDRFLKSPLDTGIMAGEWFTLKPDAEMALDQRLDDAGSLIIETPPLTEPQDFLGQPVLELDVSTEAEIGNLCARLVDIHPDGTATRVTFGVVNLAHRDGNAEPKAMPKGERTRIRLVLDAMGYRFRAGHRIRLSLSTAYWPMVLPPPTDAGVTIDLASLGLALPKLGAHKVVAIPEPANPDPLPKYTKLAPGETARGVERDLTNGLTEYSIYEDTGLFEHPGTGLATRQVRDELWSIAQDDPLSMTGTSIWTCDMQRPGWFVRTVSTATIACTATDWLISASVRAFEGEAQIFEKTFEKAIPRDFM